MPTAGLRKLGVSSFIFHLAHLGSKGQVLSVLELRCVSQLKNSLVDWWGNLHTAAFRTRIRHKLVRWCTHSWREGRPCLSNLWGKGRGRLELYKRGHKTVQGRLSSGSTVHSFGWRWWGLEESSRRTLSEPVQVLTGVLHLSFETCEQDTTWMH